jgi:TonB family protein
MTSQSQLSVAASIILHLIALLIMGGVKLYIEERAEDHVPVTFVIEQEPKLLRRSIPVRPMTSLSESSKHQSPEHYVISPEHKSSVEFYVDSPEKVFSDVKSMGQEVFRDMDIQRPAVKYRDQPSRPMATDLLNEPHLRGMQITPRVSEGHDLIGDAALAQTKPDVNITDDVLPTFFSAVRRKIESKKRYPMAAQNAGIEGYSGVRMTILKDGLLEKAEVAESSGYEILDRAALQSVYDAVPFPPIPDAVGLDRMEVSIRLVFKLSWSD